MLYLLKIFSLTYTIFEVSDGNNLSQRFRKHYHLITPFKTFLMINNTPLIIKIFHSHTIIEVKVSGFLGFFNGKNSVHVFKNVSVEQQF